MACRSLRAPLRSAVIVADGVNVTRSSSQVVSVRRWLAAGSKVQKRGSASCLPRDDSTCAVGHLTVSSRVIGVVI
jgi:hypothetical protein